MSLQSRRNKFEKGAWVHVLEPGPVAGSTVVKRRRGKIKDVLRAACLVQVNGENRPRRIRHNQLELIEVAVKKTKTKSKPESRLNDSLGAQLQDLGVLTPTDKPPPPPVALAPEPSPAVRSEDNIDAWMAMGAEIFDQMEDACQALVADITALEDAQERIEALLDLLRAQLDKKRGRLRTAQEFQTKLEK